MKEEFGESPKMLLKSRKQRKIRDILKVIFSESVEGGRANQDKLLFQKFEIAWPNFFKSFATDSWNFKSPSLLSFKDFFTGEDQIKSMLEKSFGFLKNLGQKQQWKKNLRRGFSEKETDQLLKNPEKLTLGWSAGWLIKICWSSQGFNKAEATKSQSELWHQIAKSTSWRRQCIMPN